ncbi:porin family protein [Myroides sp. LJL110]
MTSIKRIVLFLVIVLPGVGLYAKGNGEKEFNQNKDSVAYQIRAGFNLGGFSPVPLPAEIRQIKGFNPKLNLTIEGKATYWFSKGNSKHLWGVTGGIRLENKAMRTDARVKNYGMEIIGDAGEKVAGNWSGGVKTTVVNSYVTIPIAVSYALNHKWEFSLGGFYSLAIERDFSGYVYDGYLREGGPTGNKVDFMGNNVANYDFSDQLRKSIYGIEIGSSWKATRNFNVFANLNMGLNNIFRSDFKTITFDMYPIYLNVGFGYTF